MNLVGSEALVKSGVINTVVFPSFKFSSDDDAAPIWPPSPMVRSEFSQHLSIHHPSHAPKHCSLDQAAVYIYIYSGYSRKDVSTNQKQDKETKFES